MDSKDFRTHLPVMPVQNQPSWDSLQINGVVEKYLELKLEDLSKLSQSTVTADFECHDGWVAVDQKWEGVSVKALLAEAGVVSNTLNVVFNSGEYQFKLTVEEASEIDVRIKQPGKVYEKMLVCQCCTELISAYRTSDCLYLS